MKKYEPDLVLTHILGDGNPEHGQTGDLAYRAFRRALAEGARLGQLWMSLRNPPQYLERAPVRPDISVEVAAYAPLTRKALAEHVSQNGGEARHCPGEGECYEHFLLVVDGTKALHLP
jgi:LmbE family N-acetylglucosaminyl deacetylase